MNVDTCPFCGSLSELMHGHQMRDGSMLLYSQARCLVCGSSSRRMVFEPTDCEDVCWEEADKAAAAAWNRREGNGKL